MLLVPGPGLHEQLVILRMRDADLSAIGLISPSRRSGLAAETIHIGRHRPRRRGLKVRVACWTIRPFK